MSQTSRRGWGNYAFLLALGMGAAMGCTDDSGGATYYQARELLTAQLSGAIFTTLVDGSRVNANIYEAKSDVYLDGGPGMNAPVHAAGLPEGDYFFQVTDPSGKDLLSTDHISCRKVHINADGVIESVYGGTNYVMDMGSWMPVSCMHGTGLDMDHGATTVQLMPFDDTPNMGGVYKVWLTPVDSYTGNTGAPMGLGDPVNGEMWVPNNFHGFVPSDSKTDNFKVKSPERQLEPSMVTVKKFHDKNVNGMLDDGESLIEGWPVLVTDPLGASNFVATTAHMLVNAGTWSFTEDTPKDTLQTVSLVDGNIISMYPNAMPTVELDIFSDYNESHVVMFGNIALGMASACKVFDANYNGKIDSGEPYVAGWPMILTGTNVRGESVGPIEVLTNKHGCSYFNDLLPGHYTITEGNGGDAWFPTGPTSHEFDLKSVLKDGEVYSPCAHVKYTNVCTKGADFGTKGYWHNKNGLMEIEQADVDYANSLDPYMMPSSYFEMGDEPFDGFFEGGTKVRPAKGAIGKIAIEGSTLAEISAFLIDSNSGGDHREQLAQQLLAFIFNVSHRLDGPDAMILIDGDFVMASDLIQQAIDAWNGTDGAMQTEIKDILDMLNNSDDVRYLASEPCEVHPMTDGSYE